MKKYLILMIILILSVSLFSEDRPMEGIRVDVEPGEHWIHDFPLFLFIKLKNPPQMAFWVESIEGDYLSTLYVTDKISREGWKANSGNRRIEALPVWSHSRGVVYDDGIMLPTKDEPIPDDVSGATPESSFSFPVTEAGLPEQYWIYGEINHSTDFNTHYPEDALEGDPGYSGGKMGSGQPALVYRVFIDTASETREYFLELEGHSSSDGSNGEVSPDLSGITTARSIVDSISVFIRE